MLGIYCRVEKTTGSSAEVEDEESWYQSGRETVTREGDDSARLYEKVHVYRARLPVGCASAIVNFETRMQRCA